MADLIPTSTPAELARETTAFWVEVATLLDFPRSVGESYALIFLTAVPLNADDLVDQLGLSRSGAGQALKILTEIGAIRPASGMQSRKDHYELQTDLGVLVRLFLNSRALPRIEELTRRRTALAAQAQQAGSEHLIARFDKLDRWGSKTAPLITLLKTLTG
jgi:HTH-type transcriptional regulator, glycine betaine synthesis regulator